MTDPNSLVGQTVGRYRLLEHLGQGGMAEVYKAYQPSLDRYVAIKVMHAFLAREPDFLGRFEREAKSVAALQHPNIIQVHDFDVHNGMPYMVMEFVEAGTLKNHLERLNSLKQRMPLPEAARVIREVGRALAYAHQRSMIHRDVKPANVLMGTSGRVILSDFGIAKILTGPSFTMSGATVGTPAYMSPEQSLGQPGDHRSDIYSLGVVLYQLATGQLPYTADTPMAIMLKQVNEPLPPPRLVRPDLPESLERLILKAMAKNPEERFQSAEAMLAQLDNLETAAHLTAVAPLPVVSPARPTGQTGSLPPAGGSPPRPTGQTGSLPPAGGTPPPIPPVTTTPLPPAAAAGRPWFLALLSLPVLLLLCVGLGGGGLAVAYMAGAFNTATPTLEPTPRPTQTPQATATVAAPVSEIVFEDDFENDDHNWSVAVDDTTSRGYRDGEYVLEVFDGQWLVWSTPNMRDVGNIHIAVTVSNWGAEDATFGVICSYLDNESFYYLGFGEDGYYAIVRVDGEDDVFLTSEDNLWVHSEAIAEFETTYELEVECWDDGLLRLVVDGVEIAAAEDTTYPEGRVGVFAQSFEITPLEVTFDNLVVTALE